MSKGSKQRPRSVPDDVYAANYCRAFGHRVRYTDDHCATCGKPMNRIEADRELVLTKEKEAP